MVFGRFLRSSVEQVEEPKAKWFKEEQGWENCQECPLPEDEDDALMEPATAPSTQEPEEAISDDDWDWDMPGASPTDEAVEALVVDDYLLVGEPSCPRTSAEPAPCSSVQLEDLVSAEDSANGLADSTAGCDSKSSAPPAPTECPQAATAAPQARTANAGLTAASLDEEKQSDKPGYRCLVCDNPIFKEEDILSSNYHAMTGPGYLTGAAANVCVSLEMQTQVYTTGKYTVREVSCSCCASMLGVTYAGAADVRNRYKVGKFLLGRDRLRLPPGVVHPMDPK
mmetsp:Transcript_117838/g.367191  ORF Transcript_117838/g.367191 Transcript_117838/m.367191 type:complete len:282 (-) Transcript_117838:44-889(-)